MNDDRIPYGDPGWEEDALEFEARQQADEDAGIFQGDPRRCRLHPHIVTSSPDGMFDGLCWICEQACEEDLPTLPLPTA